MLFIPISTLNLIWRLAQKRGDLPFEVKLKYFYNMGVRVFLLFLLTYNAHALCPRGLDYKKYETASLEGTLLKSASEYYGVCLKHMEEMASDPAHNGKMTHGSKLEAILAEELSKTMFKDCQLKRGEASIEFEDCKGRPWDVKKPVLVTDRKFYPRQVADSFIRKMKKPYKGKPIGILFDASFLDQESYERVMRILRIELKPSEYSRIHTVCLKEDILHPISTFLDTNSIETNQTPTCP